jgi:C4-dicarboxylate-specific signal transduction histidine kinase
VAVILLLIALVSGIDYVTGIEFSLGIAYLIPIFLATWILGRVAGIATACVCTMIWTLSFTAKQPFSHPFFFAWNALIELCVYSIFVLVVNRLNVALAQADQRFVTVIEGLDSAVFVLSAADYSLLYINPKGLEAFGEGRACTAQAIGERLRLRWADLAVPRGGAATALEVQDSITKNWYWHAVREIRWVDGRRVHLHIATNISARKQAEDAARQQQEKNEVTARLVTAGEMASLLAHELSQPLAAIVNYNMGCVRRLTSGDWKVDELRDAMEKSAAQATRAGSIIKGVREFLHKRAPDLSACDLNSLISDVAQTVQSETARRNVTLRLDLDPKQPQVLADPIMLKQVLLNLIRNGIDAMEQGSPQQRELLVRSCVTAAGAVQVDVADRGCGLPPELAANPFRPFFTTKPDGMGMGLQICRSIIEFHNGKLWAAANPGGGTVFSFTLGAAEV